MDPTSSFSRRALIFPCVLLAAALGSCGDKGTAGSTSHGTSSGGGGDTGSSSGGSGGSTATTTTTSTTSSMAGAGGASGGSTGAGAACGDGSCGVGESCQNCSADCGPCCAGATCCGNGACDPGENCSTCAQDCKDAGGEPCPRVGMFYLGWHQPAYTAVQQTIALGKPVLTVEDVLRAAPPGPTYTFDQILAQNGLAGVAANFYYQASTATGPYCIVHKREPGALNYDASHEGTYGSGPAPDCPMYAETLARQAAQLTAAGVDFVATDMTNIPDDSAFGDAIQLRPFEVVLEEWRKLRKAGFKTPDVAAWHVLAAGGTMLPKVLAVYNAPENDSMILRDAKSGKKVFFYPSGSPPDPGQLSVVTGNGGKNDIVAVPMWVNGQAQGWWSFFATCQKGTLLDDAPCAQTSTANSVIGSQLAVSPSYQANYGSLPFGAVGVYGGLTLRKQFETAFAVRPRWLFISGWNEQIAQPQPNAPGVSMGFETDPTIGNQAFVDTYGVEFSRDIEPSKEYGSLIYDLVTSCLRVYRAGSATCDKPSEPCCQGGNFSDHYAYFDGAGGKFGLYSVKGGPAPQRVALYDCKAGASDEFFSPDAACEGTTVLGQPGFISKTKGGETLRPLLRCYGGGAHAYSLKGTCPAGKSPEAVLGYVR